MARRSVSLDPFTVCAPAEVRDEDFDRVIAADLKGVFMAMKYEIRAMLATRGGAIVNTSSVGALRGGGGLSDYKAAKRGVIGLTKDAAVEYAPHNIRVNVIAPGSTLTAMMQRWIATVPGVDDQLNATTPMGRMAAPEEVAKAALWLCSDAASYVTGVVLPVDGGLTA